MGAKRGRKKAAKPSEGESSRNATLKKQAAFLKAFAVTGAVSQAADAVGMDRRQHYRWMEKPDYAERFAHAEREALDSLVHEAVHRARDGVMRLKFHQGVPIMVPLRGSNGEPEKDEKGETVFVPYVEYEKSDTLLIFLLKTLGREKFGDRIEQRFTGELKHSGAIEIRTILETLESDPAWQRYARGVEANRFPGLLRSERQSRPLELGAAPGAN